jgi:mannose-1-phosphate guanylyltransferase
MPALVLAAGLGVRLRPLTQVRAKPAIPVAGQPIVRRIIGWLSAQGITDVVINLHHLPHTLTAVVGDGSDLGVRVRYSWEAPQVLGSAGGPRRALDILGAEQFLLVNGDTLTDVNLGRLAAAHTLSGALVTLALASSHDPNRYGGVRLDDDGRVVGFASRGAAAGSWHFLGVQMVSATAFRSVPADTPANSIGGVYDQLIASAPGAVRGLIVDARFSDVGTVSDYWTTSGALMRAEGLGDTVCGSRVHLDRSARVTRSILWDDVSVGAGSALDECIVTDGVHVPPGSDYRRAVLVGGPADRLTATPF